MISLNFKSTKTRSIAHVAMQIVADDVRMFIRHINQSTGRDEEPLCPEGKKDKGTFAVINCTELWFGTTRPNELIDVSVHTKSLNIIKTSDPFLSLLFQLTCLSLCEQFSWSSFTTDENFDEAVEIYESLVGSISDNACRSLKIPERK